MRCNNSFVHEIFQAQFRSSLTCPLCQKQSNTFDPFLCVSVPVPQGQRQMSLFVNVLYTSQQPRQVRIGVSVSQAANVKELREILASDTGIDENHLLLTEVHDEGFHRLVVVGWVKGKVLGVNLEIFTFASKQNYRSFLFWCGDKRGNVA